MTLDSTLKEANVVTSIKKFFADTFETGLAKKLLFDVGLSTPDVLNDASITEWISVKVGGIDLETLSSVPVLVYLCTRKDAEGFVLSTLRDTVLEQLIDSDKTDGRKRIPLYDIGTWTEVGGMVVSVEPDSENMTADDGTKFKIMMLQLRWGAKI